LEEPLVSIALPVFNAEDTLAAAIRSIIRQSYSGWELIIIDDGSTDRSLDIARGFVDSRIRIVADGKNLQLPARLNQGVAMSRGKYFARMDADDVSYPERLMTQVEFLETHPEIDLLGSRILIFSENGCVVGTYPFRESHEEICNRPTAGFYLPHPTWMGKAEWFRRNPYNRSIPKAQDQELLLRTHSFSRLSCLSEILLGYRKADLSLKTILTGRSLYSRMLFSKAISEKRYVLLLGVIEQAIKLMMETFAIATGLNYRILQHRALPVSRAEAEKWERVWIDCSTSTYGR